MEADQLVNDMDFNDMFEALAEIGIAVHAGAAQRAMSMALKAYYTYEELGNWQVKEVRLQLYRRSLCCWLDSFAGLLKSECQIL